jgi:hypothetical protein
MNLKIKTILNSMGALHELQGLALPGSVSHDVTRLILKLKPELEAYDITRNNLSEVYREKYLALPEEERAEKEGALNQELQKEVTDLQEKEVDVKFRKVNGAVLRHLTHTPNMTVHLGEWLIDLPEDENNEDYV